MMDGLKNFVSLNLLGFLVGLIGTVASILSLAGVNLPINDLIALIFFCSSCILFYANIQQGRKLTRANRDLDEVPDKIKQAVKAVYEDSNEKLEKLQTKIDNLEIEAATWKDRSTNYQDKANSLKKERDEADERIEKIKKEAYKEFRREFSEYIEFQVGKRHYVTSEIKIAYNQESFEHLTEKLSPDLRDKSLEVWRKISEY